MTSPRWLYGLFLTLLPSQEEQLTIIQEQVTTKRILEHSGKAEATPRPQRWRQSTLEGKRNTYKLTTFFRPAWYRERSPWASVPPVVKESPAEQLATSSQHHGSFCFVGTPTLISPLRNYSGIFRGSTTGNLTVMEKRGGTCYYQHRNLGRNWVHTCSAQVVIPTSGLIWAWFAQAQARSWASPSLESPGPT